MDAVRVTKKVGALKQTINTGTGTCTSYIVDANCLNEINNLVGRPVSLASEEGKA
jgi:hypothetical protein